MNRKKVMRCHFESTERIWRASKHIRTRVRERLLVRCHDVRVDDGRVV